MPQSKSTVPGAAPLAVEVPPTQRAIPFGRPIIDAAERDAVLAVLSQPVLTHGPLGRRFEEAFAAFTAAPHAVATSSCTAALHLAYLFPGLGPGDEVIVPALTHVGTAHAVELCGARCVFVDAEPHTGNLDLDRVEAAVTDSTRAISVVHFLGMPVDMVRVVAFARRHGLFVVEDCALALGSKLDGRHVGLHGDAGCFSFYPVKHVTTAEGGMLITRRADLAADAARRRAFGIDRNVVADRPVPGEYDVTHLGHNYRLNEIAAALGLTQMQRLAAFLAARRANHDALSAGLRELDEVRVLEGPGGRFASACYCLGLVLEGTLGSRRQAVVAELKARGVGTSVYYPRPVPHLSYYSGRYGIADNSYPVARRLSARSIALPVGPHLEPEDLPYIIASVKDAIAAVK
ncbi:MAG: DegT/DnrJ/EryC1/StrS family aminotransferase [Planctomycetota bacterium]|jgi:dTDP-4-amino-4,6-dideoxygalactose transaminase